jgi:Fe-S oxidoreductase/nitrate reductase gamma subunit
LWREKKPAGIGRDWRGLISSVVIQAGVLKRPKAGIAHLAVFWGVILPLGVVVAAQFGATLPLAFARLLSLIQDLAGLALLVGTLWFMARRCRKAQDDQGPSRVLFPMGLLLVILISGFLAAGARIAILGGGGGSSPGGWLFSWLAPASPLFMQMMIRLHFVAVLLLIATLPYTFMRHAVTTPLNLLYRKSGPKAALTLPALEAGEFGAGRVADLNWKQLLDADACAACGRCDEICPAALSGKSLSPRRVIQEIGRQMATELAAGRGAGNGGGDGNRDGGDPVTRPLLADRISPEEMWACTTCMACVAHCPAAVEPLDKIIDLRRYQVMQRACLPHEAQPMLRDLELYGDVQGKGAAHRADWAMHRGVSQWARLTNSSEARPELLLYVGCSGAFHPRNQETSRAMVKILKRAGVDFAILGREEVCCGDPARRLGDEHLFRKLARANIERFERYGVKKIVTLCPHCLNTLKNEYPDLGCSLEVVHATELVAELIAEKRIRLKYPVAEKVTLHDACYLGRYNDVYQPPREICGAVPGTRLRETERHGDNGFCCGGGGGRMWLHETSGENINLIRAKEVARTEADLIGTACPYCLVMLDDGIKSLELEKAPKVADIIDMVADSLG